MQIRKRLGVGYNRLICFVLLLCTIMIAPLIFFNRTTKNITKYIHLSIDDVELCLQNLSTKQYESIFDEPLFNYLKNLHKDYNAKFTLFVYSDALLGIPNTYSAELKNASGWIKFGYHSKNKYVNLETMSVEQIKQSYNDFISAVNFISDGADNIDYIIRLQNFAGSKDKILALTELKKGPIGFLTSDDKRVSYYLNEEESKKVYTENFYKDVDNKLLFFSTDMRIEWFAENYESEYKYREPVYGSVYEELKYMTNNKDYNNIMKELIVFTHEWYIYDGCLMLKENKSRFEDVCKFASYYNVKFDYPQNNI